MTLAQRGVHMLWQRHQSALHVVFALQRGTAGGERLVPVASSLAAEVVFLLQSGEVNIFAHYRAPATQKRNYEPLM